MKIMAKSNYIRMTPRKVRLVADSIRQLSPEEAIITLKATNKSAAKPLLDTLRQGIGNAVNNFKLKSEDLIIKEIQIGEGPVFKRWRAASRGQAHQVLKRTSHIRIVLEGKSKKEGAEKKSKRSKNGTKS